MAYLRAYQAYQRKDYDTCVTLLQELKQTRMKLDLLAQVYFQKMEYQRAYEIYNQIIEEGDDLVEERKENLQTLIVCAQLEQPGQLKCHLPTVEEIIDQVELINLNDPTVENLISKTKKNKKRRTRIPKYDPNKEPDPERWIPKRDRKNAPKKKRRHVKGRKGRI